MVKASTTSAKGASPVKRKTVRRTRILSEAPDGEAVELASAPIGSAAGTAADAEEEDGRPKNEFIDDEAVEDNEEEVVEEDEMADFIDDGEPTDDNGDNKVTAQAEDSVEANAQSNASAATEILESADLASAQVVGSTDLENGEQGDDSDGEHSAHSIMIRAAGSNVIEDAGNEESPVAPSAIITAPSDAPMTSVDAEAEVEFDGVRPAAQYFAGFKPNYASNNYQALLRDAISQRIGISDYAYTNGAYRTVHVYDAFPRTSSSAWKPVGALDFPDTQEVMESLYPAFGTMRIICDTMNFSACAGYVNLARVNPSRFSFVTGDQKKDGILSRVSDPTGPAYCITIGLVRQCFIGPNGFEIEGGYRRGITLAPFESEAYRTIASLNKAAGMEGADHFTYPLYSNGGFAFTTKTLSGDGLRPIVPGWTTAPTVKKGRPELVSDRSTARKKPGVLAYADEIPIVDARCKRVVWGTDTLSQLVNKSIWPRFVGNLEYDSVAVVVYTTNRWGRENMDRIAFNIHSVVLLADPPETTSAAAAAKIKHDYLANKGKPSKKRLTHERPSSDDPSGDLDGGKRSKTAE